MNTIAIDCGASFVKGALIENGVIVKRQQTATPPVPKDNDIKDSAWINGLFRIVEDVVWELADGLTEAKLCVSNEMHGFLLAYENDSCFTDYISWQREYGSVPVAGISSLEVLRAEAFQDEIRLSGMPARAGLPSSNLLWLKRVGYLSKAKEKLRFYTLGDYLLKRFSGITPDCHPTNAAATGLFRVTDDCWNEELINKMGINDIVFPKVGDQPFSVKKKDTIFHIYPALGDQQAALLGAGLKKEQDLSFNLGTGAQVSRLVSTPELSNRYQTRPYFGGKFLQTLPHLPSGRALNVYFRFFKSIFDAFGIEKRDKEIWEQLIKSGKEGLASELECDLSFFENPITPHTVGSITNISEYSLSLENLMGSIYKQMAANFLQAADRIGASKSSVSRIVFSGGIAEKTDVLRELILEHFSPGTEVVIAKDETLIGLYRYSEDQN